MKNYEDITKQYKMEYKERLKENRALLIEAFTIYYGEEYREYITKMMDQIHFGYFSSEKNAIYYDLVIRSTITRQSFFVVCQLLSILGFDTEGITAQIKECGKLFVEEDSVKIDYGSIYDVRNQKGECFDEVLEYLYGPSHLFSFDFKKDKIMSFFSLSKEEQEHQIKYLFPNEKDRDIVEQRMTKALSFLEKEREKECDFKELFFDFYLVEEHFLEKKKNPNYRKSEFLGFQDGRLNTPRLCCISQDIKYMVDDYPKSATTCDVKTKEMINIVLLPILSVLDIDIIHEINHALTSSVLAERKNGLVIKKGIAIDDDTALTKDQSFFQLEELLNHKSSREIETIFHNLGGKIIKRSSFLEQLLEETNYCALETYFPLIDPFYEKYKEILKKVRITEQTSLLYQWVDKEKFLFFVSYLNAIMEQTQEEAIEFDEHFLNTVTKMVESFSNSSEMPKPKIQIKRLS